MNTSPKRAVTAVVALVVVLVGFLAYRHHASGQGTVRYVTATASKGSLITSVSGSGNVTVDQITKVSPSISGTVSNLSVKLGDQVKKGQTLFAIQNDQLDVTVGKSYATYLQAKQALASAQAGLITAQTTYKNQSQDDGQAKAQAGLDQANQALLAAQSQLSQDQQTLADTSSTASNYSTLQAKVATDQAGLTTAQDNVSAATIALQQAQATASGAVQAARQQLTAAQTSVEAAQKNVDTDWADYNNQLTSAGERTVTAPIDGTITTLSISNGDQLGGSGAAAAGSSSASSSSSAPVVIADLSTLKATVQVSEVDASKVKPGQKASMTFDAIDGLTLTGKVDKIDTVGTATQGVVTYATTISFDSLDPRVRPEMSVSATITTDVKQDVLTVPNAAVKSSQSGGSYVQIMQNGAPRQQSVQVGESNDTDTEITSGLNEGDVVVTQTIAPSATVTPSATRSSSGLGGLGGGGTFRAAGGLRGN